MNAKYVFDGLEDSCDSELAQNVSKGGISENDQD